MAQTISGIHHVTAVASDPQENIDFYTGVLGLRMIKLTVNFDDPNAYHLYYGDITGNPGTALTFFTWPYARRGRPGIGQASTIAFTISENSTDYWMGRLQQLEVERRLLKRFGQPVIAFQDPDGIDLELIGVADALPATAWEGSPVPQEHFVYGFHSVSLPEQEEKPTAALLGDIFGFEAQQRADQRVRYEAPGNELARSADLIVDPQMKSAFGGTGTIHHVAWRAKDDEAQLMWRERLLQAGLDVTPVIDRQYFHSIYFREPGGILFEIATDQPGFLIDESLETLGTSLRLPPWFEPHRAQIQEGLPVVRLPGSVSEAANPAPKAR